MLQCGGTSSRCWSPAGEVTSAPSAAHHPPTPRAWGSGARRRRARPSRRRRETTSRRCPRRCSDADPKRGGARARAHGARAEHAPGLQHRRCHHGRLGAAAGAPPAPPTEATRDHESAEVREEIVFDAACAAASMGWSEAAGAACRRVRRRRRGSSRGGSSRDGGTRTRCRRAWTPDDFSEVDCFEIGEIGEHEAAAPGPTGAAAQARDAPARRPAPRGVQLRRRRHRARGNCLGRPQLQRRRGERYAGGG